MNFLSFINIYPKVHVFSLTFFLLKLNIDSLIYVDIQKNEGFFTL